jgi:hypothetical protein
VKGKWDRNWRGNVYAFLSAAARGGGSLVCVLFVQRRKKKRFRNEEVKKKIKILCQQTPCYNERHGKFIAHFYAITLFVFLVFFPVKALR